MVQRLSAAGGVPTRMRGDYSRHPSCPIMALLGIMQNQTFDEIKVGDRAGLVRTLIREDVEDFAECGAAMISELLATRLPGTGTTYVEETLRFRRPVTIGEAITAMLLFARRGPKH
jgi:hypothetical protein